MYFRLADGAGVGPGERVLNDISIRAQVRLTAGRSIGLGVRGNPGAPFDNYFFNLAPNGDAWLGIGTNPIGTITLGRYATDLVVTDEDVVLQLDVIGDSLRAWALRPRATSLPEPMLIATDDRIASGTFGVYTVGPGAEGEFRYIHVADTHIHPADFNNDGMVDGNDGLLWQQGFGMQVGVAPDNGDADDDGDVDGGDFLAWQRQYGTGTGAPANAAVPEPASIALLLTLSGIALARCRMRTRR